jgi:hypothetical protein
MRYALLIAILLAAAATASAQQPQAIKPPPRFSFTWADGVFAAGVAVDGGFSVGKRERLPIYRNDRGLFSGPRYALTSAGFWGGFKVLEAFYRKPNERRLIRIVEASVGVTRFAIGFLHNRNISKVRHD